MKNISQAWAFLPAPFCSAWLIEFWYNDIVKPYRKSLMTDDILNTTIEACKWAPQYALSIGISEKHFPLIKYTTQMFPVSWCSINHQITGIKPDMVMIFICRHAGRNNRLRKASASHNGDDDIITLNVFMVAYYIDYLYRMLCSLTPLT